jgi:signal transduction histidine kinase
MIAVDRVRLGRVLRNLVDNALRHTPSGGQVVVNAYLADASVGFQVIDSGPGIPAHDRERIFDRFYRGEPSRRREQSSSERPVGAGLGLAIARGVVEAHGGQIWAEAAPHGGASLCFTVPTAPSSAPVSARPA